MSLNAMHRSIMIFSNKQEKAENKLNEIVNDLGEEIIVRKKDYIKTKSKTIQAKVFSENCRGYRYKEVYVDYSLANDPEKMNLILMKLVPPHYYSNVPFDEDYNWRDYVYYF